MAAGLLLPGCTSNSSVPAASLEDFLGLPSASLNGIGNGDTYQGSAIKQTFTANAGQVLSFDWNFLTNEETPSQFFNDFFFVNISSANNVSSLSKLAETASGLTASPTSNYPDTNKRFAKETGFKTFTYSLPTTGIYTLEIGVTNVGDPYGVSGVLIDNATVSTTSVPEPNSPLGILVFGSLGMGLVLKRQRQNKV